MTEDQTTAARTVEMTVGDLRELIDDVPDEAPVTVSVYNHRLDEWDRIPVEAAEVRRGFNAPPMLVLAFEHPQRALA